MQEETGAHANNSCENNGQFTAETLCVAFRAGTTYLVVIEIQTDYSLVCSKATREIFVG